MPTTSVVKATDVLTPLMPFSSLPPTVPSRRRKRRDIPHYQETEAGTLPHKYVGTSRVPVVPRSTIPLIYQVICIEYSRAVTPQVRQAGNRLSGLTETAYASLLA